MSLSPPTRYALSIVIPLFRSESSISSLLAGLEQLDCDESWQVIFVDDGSPDNTHKLVMNALENSPLDAVLIRHTRNFGEHQAVLTGYRHAKGDFIVNIDDDLQNPPDEALRLWRHGRSEDLDVVYGHYTTKQHAFWRNLGSCYANATAQAMLDMPFNYYLSSFRCVNRLIAKKVATYQGPYVYIDGMLAQLTNRIGTLEVRHDSRLHGESSYNLRRLIRLWLVILTSFSLMPLRIASLLGILIAAVGAFSLVYILYTSLLHSIDTPGWASIISAILFFGGIQCLLLGMLGEYIGRIYLSVNGKPQSSVRTIQYFHRTP